MPDQAEEKGFNHVLIFSILRIKKSLIFIRFCLFYLTYCTIHVNILQQQKIIKKCQNLILNKINIKYLSVFSIKCTLYYVTLLYISRSREYLGS